METPNIIIALIGKKQSGKDTFYNILEKNGYNMHQVAFATPIKQIAKILFDFNDEELYGSKKEIVNEEWGIKPREFYQIFGTEIFQHDIHKYLPSLKCKQKTIWANILRKNIEEMRHTSKIIVITDLRHIHEKEIIQDLPNIYFVKINRNNIANIDNHISETELNTITCDYIINNDTNLIDYEKKIIELINTILHK